MSAVDGANETALYEHIKVQTQISQTIQRVRFKRRGICVRYTKLIHLLYSRHKHIRWSELDEMLKERSNHTPITNEVTTK